MIVLDASAAFALLLRNAAGQRLAVRIVEAGEDVNGPELLDIELAQVLRRHVLRGTLSPGRATAALDAWRDFDVTLHSHDAFLRRVWQMRQNLSAYDAVYVALAESLDVPLITCDRGISRAPGHRARVEVFGADA